MIEEDSWRQFGILMAYIIEDAQGDLEICRQEEDLLEIGWLSKSAKRHLGLQIYTDGDVSVNAVIGNKIESKNATLDVIEVFELAGMKAR